MELTYPSSVKRIKVKFRDLGGIDFVQINYGEYQVLLQSRCTRNTQKVNITFNIKSEWVKNQSTLVRSI